MSSVESGTAWENAAEDRARLDRVGTAEKLAEILRDRVVEGYFPPGSRLSEEVICSLLNVSRNTVREAFRLLCHERLAVHEFARGVFVRELSDEDISDVYRLRRMLECAAVREFPAAPQETLRPIEEAINRGAAAALANDWRSVGTADLHFHQGIIRIVQSPRLDEFIQRVLAELRLAFAVMPNLRSFHEPYLERNRTIWRLLSEDKAELAEMELVDYLKDAERQLLQMWHESQAQA
jgi:DNA-binding GntR family transcriptional regulator